MNGKYRETELGTEARCAKCGEYWPADEEFFYRRGHKLHPLCKACHGESTKRIKRREEAQRLAV